MTGELSKLRAEVIKLQTENEELQSKVDDLNIEIDEFQKFNRADGVKIKALMAECKVKEVVIDR